MLPKLMLLTRVAPGDQGVGPQYLRDVCRFYSPDRLCCFHVPIVDEPPFDGTGLCSAVRSLGCTSESGSPLGTSALGRWRRAARNRYGSPGSGRQTIGVKGGPRPPHSSRPPPHCRPGRNPEKARPRPY